MKSFKIYKYYKDAYYYVNDISTLPLFCYYTIITGNYYYVINYNIINILILFIPLYKHYVCYIKPIIYKWETIQNISGLEHML